MPGLPAQRATAVVILTDWITSGSTFGTMIVAGMAAWATLAMYRRDVRREMPIIEPDFGRKTDPTLGDYVEVNLKIVNRLEETLLVSSVTVDRPRSAMITRGGPGVGQSGYRGQVPTPSIKRTIDLDWPVQPSGSYDAKFMEAFVPAVRTDVARRTFYLLPPPSWDEGIVRMTLTVSSKALTIRDKRSR
jgi:hypothetical protein